MRFPTFFHKPLYRDTSGVSAKHYRDDLAKMVEAARLERQQQDQAFAMIASTKADREDDNV